jgi:hypothetical protein|tara:strand:+ start:1130 stop:2044 length:915 start_codon:yes stop_codon:yes gene_type:complete
MNSQDILRNLGISLDIELDNSETYDYELSSFDNDYDGKVINFNNSLIFDSVPINGSLQDFSNSKNTITLCEIDNRVNDENYIYSGITQVLEFNDFVLHFNTTGVTYQNIQLNNDVYTYTGFENETHYFKICAFNEPMPTPTPSPSPSSTESPTPTPSPSPSSTESPTPTPTVIQSFLWLQPSSIGNNGGTITVTGNSQNYYPNMNGTEIDNAITLVGSPSWVTINSINLQHPIPNDYTDPIGGEIWVELNVDPIGEGTPNRSLTVRYDNTLSDSHSLGNFYGDDPFPIFSEVTFTQSFSGDSDS